MGTASPPSPGLPRLAVIHLPIAQLAPDPKNPRVHTKRQVRQIARSIEAFGFNVPLLVDGNNRVIAGHGRLQACQFLGWNDVPTIRLEHLSAAQARAFMIADNRLTETATWDDRLLAEQLLELSVLDLDFRLDATGFEMGEIDLRIESLSSSPEDRTDTADEAVAPGPAVTVPGDLWLLGDHRILCASALDETAYTTVMAGRQAAMVFTDPPYNVRIGGHVCGKGAIKHREFGMASGEMSAAEFKAFLGTAFGLIARFATNGSIHFVCMDWRHLPEVLDAGAAAYTELKNLCVWAKDNAGMGSLYRSQHELILVYKLGTAAHVNNVELGRFGRSRSNVWRYPGVNSFGRTGAEGNLLALHPTVKPTAMVADAMLDCSNRHDIVLDPFLGSGTMVMAAERTGRLGYGIELDPLYVDTAIRRWQAFTGRQACHAVSGRIFDDLQAERATNIPPQPEPNHVD